MILKVIITLFMSSLGFWIQMIGNKFLIFNSLYQIEDRKNGKSFSLFTLKEHFKIYDLPHIYIVSYFLLIFYWLVMKMFLFVQSLKFQKSLFSLLFYLYLYLYKVREKPIRLNIKFAKLSECWVRLSII